VGHERRALAWYANVSATRAARVRAVGAAMAAAAGGADAVADAGAAAAAAAGIASDPATGPSVGATALGQLAAAHEAASLAGGAGLHDAVSANVSDGDCLCRSEKRNAAAAGAAVAAELGVLDEGASLPAALAKWLALYESGGRRPRSAWRRSTTAAAYLRRALVPALADASRDGGWMERAGCCAEMGG